MSTPRIALAPEQPDWAAAAVEEGGGRLVGVDQEPEGLVWTTPGAWQSIGDTLRAAPGAGWVQLPFAGVEGVLASGALTPDRTWTCAKGVYSEPVAEHALALTLACLRRLPRYARAGTWEGQSAQTLYDADVAVLGAGGITAALIGLLAPFRCRVTVLRRDASSPVAGAARTAGMDELDEVLGAADVAVLALALTPETERVIGAEQLRRLGPDGVLVNVARGRHVDTAALVEALQDGALGAAGLDVTDPEPLPDDSPLWTLPGALVTPHTANPWLLAQPLLARRIADNVRRYGAGEELVGLVDVEAGY